MKIVQKLQFLSSWKRCFFQIVFEDITIVDTLECVRGFVTKRWTNVKQGKLTVVSLAKRTFKFLKTTS